MDVRMVWLRCVHDQCFHGFGISWPFDRTEGAIVQLWKDFCILCYLHPIVTHEGHKDQRHDSNTRQIT